MAGNGWGEEAAGDERAWLRGRLRTANGWGDLRGRLQTAWVPGSGWKWVGRRSRWRSASLPARTAADGKWVRRIARTAADGVGAREWLEMGWEEAAGDQRAWLRRRLRTGNGCRELRGRLHADGVGATDWLEMGGEKKPLVMSELGCADGCGREMGAENCADGCGRRRCNGLVENGWGDEAAGDQRAWLRGRVRTGNGRGELRGRLRTAWVQGTGWKWVGRRSRWRSASLAAQTAADGKWVRRIARTAADGVGAREWLEMGGEKKPLVMSELGCADGCGRDMGAKNCADGCGRRELLEMSGDRAGGERAWLRGRLRTGNGYGCARRGCKGVAGNGCGAEAAGDERAWLRGRLRTANGWGELRGRLRTARVLGSGCADGCGRQMGAENCADGCGRRGCKGAAGNGSGEAAGDERAWLRGRLRTANGWGELRGRLRTAWVQGSGWKCVGRRSRW